MKSWVTECFVTIGKLSIKKWEGRMTTSSYSPPVAISFRIDLTSALDIRRAFVVSYQFAIDTPTALWERGDKSNCVGVVPVEGDGYCI